MEISILAIRISSYFIYLFLKHVLPAKNGFLGLWSWCIYFFGMENEWKIMEMN